MIILVILALTFAIYPPALPWVAGLLILDYVGSTLVYKFF